ncbi:MAG: M42 family metallopeptidase [Verrucomicrobiae bacterium]|nr:M42 family metallopeptidase [Verrucomicrobiae bacterium]
MKPASLDFLKELLGTVSVTSQERPAQRVWLNYVKRFADRVETDAYGNAMAFLNEKGSPKVMIAGHCDEIGFMVQHITEEGFIYFTAVGEVDPALVRGQRLCVQTKNGPVLGVTGALAPHMQDRDKNPETPKLHECFLDIGARNRKEAQKLVRVGDVITFVDGFEILRGDLVVARGCDDRIGAFAAAEVIRLLKGDRKNRACVVAVSTVQEEIGALGARMAAYQLHPDVAFAVDVGQATDIPLVNKNRFGDVRMGKGPAIGRGSANHPVVVDRLERVAAKRKLPVQFSTDPRGTGTDADAIFWQRGGIPSAAIGVPNRYMHSPVEVVHLRDLEQAAELVAAFCRDLKDGERFVVKI